MASPDAEHGREQDRRTRPGRCYDAQYERTARSRSPQVGAPQNRGDHTGQAGACVPRR